MNKWTDKLKFGASKSSNYDKSHKIFLTQDLKLDIDEFKNLTNFTKVYRYDILDEYGYDMLKDKEKKAHEFLSKKIIENETDLIIGNAFWNLSDVLSIEKLINKGNKSIDRLYIPSPERREKLLAVSQESFKNFNRWIDEPPGRLEEVYEKATNSLKKLKKGLKNMNIEVVEI